MKTIALALCAACAASHDPVQPHDVATVRVFEEGVAAQGRIAVFQDPGGAVRTTLATATDGTATAPIRAGDMVTLANVGAPKFDLTTYVQLQPNDLAVVGELAGEDRDRSGGLAQVALPPPPSGALASVGAGRSLVAHPGAPVGLQLVETGAGHYVVVGIAADASGAPIAFTTRDVTAAGPVTLPAWRTDWERTVVHAPAGAAVTLDVLAGDARFPALAAGDARVFPAGIASAMDLRVAVAGRTWRRVGPLAHDVTVTELLPAVTRVDVATGARPTVAWTLAGAADPTAIVVIRLAWGVGDAHRWTVIAPASLARFQFPALPDELAAWRPEGELRAGVGVVDSSAVAGYREWMRRGIEELDDVGAGTTLRTSVSGHLAL